MISDRCDVCGSDDTERLTGEELPFVGMLTVYDEEYGFTYVRCKDCSIVQAVYFIPETNNYYIDRAVTWDLSQIERRLEEMTKI